MSSIKKIENAELNKSFKITIDNKDFITEYEGKVLEIQKTIKMDGFRKGKVPESIIKQKYSAVVLSESAEALINKEVKNLVAENKFELAKQAKIDIKTLAIDSDLEFEVSLELLPEIPEIRFDKIKLKQDNIVVTKKDVEEEKVHILRNKAEWEEVKEEAKDGDKVMIDFNGKIDDVEFEGGKSQNYGLILGSKSFIDTFEEQLIGKKSGDEVAVKVTFPKDYGKQELADKKAVFDVKVNSVLRAKVPELTDEFIKENFNIENLEKFEETIEKELKNAYTKTTKNKLKKDIFDYLDKNIKFTLPSSIVEDEIKRNTSEEATDDDKKKAKEKAEREVKLGLIISDLAKKNDIKTSNEEVTAEIYKMARMYPGQEQMMVDLYTKNQFLINQIASQVVEGKVIDYIAEKINLENNDITLDEFIKKG
ncbi:MAG: trigger factor [Rickettsiales bacterium]|jgi:trigger factor|nr:trigger factor [Rickettsiales bacterium]